MEYDIILISGEVYFDHPLSGAAIIKRWLEKNGFTVGVIETPQTEEDITELGKPKLFFGITSGSMDSMLRNYTPLKKIRNEDKHQKYSHSCPNRAVIVYSNWIRSKFKYSIMVLGGTEASLRRFIHYDYWDNKLRKPILFDTRADILAYGNSEKQILEIANKVKNKKSLIGIPGTCIITKEVPKDVTLLPSFDEVSNSKEKFCDFQNLLTNEKNLIQKIDNRYVLQFKSPIYTSKDLDEYYDLGFSRQVPKEMRGFQFSVVSHRGCIGGCHFCAINLIQGNKIISRSEKSILKEIEEIKNHPKFRGNIDDLGGPSANMYGLDCNKCNNDCFECNKKPKGRWLKLLKKARKLARIYIKSGVRYELLTDEETSELYEHHIFDTLRIAPEHINKNILTLMNKNRSDFTKFIKGKSKLSYYFMMCHPGSTMKEAKELADIVKKLDCPDAVQMFTPTPMTISTCMYYTGLNPKNKKAVYVPYTYIEKKKQKRLLL
jgi:uncharacterized radical SAM protein YgiQ